MRVASAQVVGAPICQCRCNEQANDTKLPGVGVGACCWDECEQIGAKPGANQAEPPKIKLKSRDKDRALQSDSERQTDEETHSPYAVRSRYGRRQRMTTNQNKNPFGDPPPAPAPKWNVCHPFPFDLLGESPLTLQLQCKGERIGKGYTKSGKQVVDPNSYPCTGEGCSLTHDFSVSVASSISSEESTTFTNSEGETQNINTGFQWIGPTVTYDHGWTKDFSEAVATSTGTSTSNTKSKSVSFTQQLTIGYEYNGKALLSALILPVG